VNTFVGDVRSSADETRRRLALLCVGELGRECDLQSVASLQSIILNSFESGEEETKTAAAYALGHIAVGNMKAFLPAILDALETNPKHQYLLLSALKEVILCHTSTPGRSFADYCGRVCDNLFPYADAPDEGVRNMVAECLGALVTLQATHVLPKLSKLAEATGEAGALKKWTVATALKCTMGGNAPVAELEPSIGRYLELLRDDDLDVQRAALLMVNAAVHHQTPLVAALLPGDVLTTLFSKIEIKLERVVDLGPFKHRVDDGLPLRKAALSCVHTILENCPQQMDAAGFMRFLALGLADKDDVQMLSHQILVRLCAHAPVAVLSSIELLVEPLDKTVNKKVKDSQVGTEVERANDLIRSGLRAIVAVVAIEESTAGAAHKFLERCQKKEKLAQMLQVIDAEAIAA